MPQAFTSIRSPSLSTNSFGQNENCYYCTVAALLNTTTSQLVNVTQTMMQDRASADEIVALMAAAGIPNPSYVQLQTLAAVQGALASLPDNQAVGLAYTRIDGTGHMIVAAKHNGVGGFIDYQASPPQVSAAFPEPMGNITSMHVFFHS
jgi:hypothetical protein